MGLKIHHPRLLIFALLGIMLIGSAVALYAGQNENDTTARPFPAIPVSADVTPADEEEALRIVEAAGTVETINNHQSWVAANYNYSDVGGAKVVKFHVTWPNPVTSSGPWVVVMCGGALTAESSVTFSNVTRLAMFVDLKSKEIVGTAIGAPPEDTPGAVPETITPAHNIKAYDAETGQLVYDGSINNIGDKCPEGTKQG